MRVGEVGGKWQGRQGGEGEGEEIGGKGGGLEAKVRGTEIEGEKGGSERTKGESHHLQVSHASGELQWIKKREQHRCWGGRNPRRQKSDQRYSAEG